MGKIDSFNQIVLVISMGKVDSFNPIVLVISMGKVDSFNPIVLVIFKFEWGLCFSTGNWGPPEMKKRENIQLIMLYMKKEIIPHNGSW